MSQIPKKDWEMINGWVKMGYSPAKAIELYLSQQKAKEPAPKITTPTSTTAPKQVPVIDPQKKSSMFGSISQIPRNLINKITGGPKPQITPNQPSAPKPQAQLQINDIPVKHSFGEQASSIKQIIQTIPVGSKSVFLTDQGRPAQGMFPICHGLDRTGQPSYYHVHFKGGDQPDYTYQTPEREASRVATLLYQYGQIKKYAIVPLSGREIIKHLGSLEEEKE